VRFRRKRRPRRAAHNRATRKGDWIILGDNACEDGIHLGDQNKCVATREDLIPSTLAFTWIDDSDIEEKQDSLTIVRMVGEVINRCDFTIGGTASIPNGMGIAVTACEGIYITSDDPNGDIQELIPGFRDDLELDNWLWLRKRVTLVQVGGVAANGVVYSAGGFAGEADGARSPHLDIRVARKLKRGTELIYACTYYWEDITGFTGATPGVIGGTGSNLSIKVGVQMQMRGYVKF